MRSEGNLRRIDLLHLNSPLPFDHGLTSVCPLLLLPQYELPLRSFGSDVPGSRYCSPLTGLDL